MKYYTSDTLIESVKRRAMLPESEATFTSQDYLDFANEELDLSVVPLVMSFHEDYLMYTQPVPLVANQIRYEIPSRAMGNKIRDVQFQDSSGYIYEMTRIFIEDVPYFQQGNGYLRAFYMEGNEIVFPTSIDAPTLSGNLLISIYLRCSELVDEDRVARVTDINTTTGVISLDSWPTNFSEEPLIDFTSIRSPHKIIKFDITPVSFGSAIVPQITFNVSDIPTQLRVGDIVSNAEETIIPQVPSELHSMLAQCVAIRCLEALGDTQGLQNAIAKLEKMEEKAGNILENRAEGSPLKVNPRHTFLKKKQFLRR